MTLFELLILANNMFPAIIAEASLSSDSRYWALRNSTLPEMGPTTLAKKATMLGAKANRHTIFATVTQQIRTTRDAAKTDDTLYVVNGQAHFDFIIHMYCNRFPFFRQIGSLGGYKQNIEQFTHFLFNHSLHVGADQWTHR